MSLFFKLLLSLSLLGLLVSCGPTKQPVPIVKRHSISGEVTLVNECTGKDADNPKSFTLKAVIKYKNEPIPSVFTKTIKLKPTGDGVTSKGKYFIEDLPNNLKGDHWTLDFVDICTQITPCDPASKTCKNQGTSARMPIKITGLKSTYDKRYSCGCI